MSVSENPDTSGASDWSGPPPEILERYDVLAPGVGQEMLQHGMKLADHFCEQEKRKLEADIEDRKAERAERRRGQIFGLAVGIFAISAGATTAIFGGEGAAWAGGFIGTGGVVGLVSVFVIGRRWGDTRGK